MTESLDAKLQSYIEEKHVTGALLERLSVLGGALGPVLKLIELTNPSANTLRETLRAADEICRRDNLELAELLVSAPLLSILETTGGSRKEKQKLLRTQLEKLRYPVRTEIEGQLSECRRALLSRYGVKFACPEDLEGDQVEVGFSVRSAEELKKLGEAIVRSAGDPACEKLFSMLKGRF